MIRRRLVYRTFWFRLLIYLLPAAASGAAGYFRFAVPIRPVAPDIDPSSYVLLVLFTSLVWAISAERYGLCRFSDLRSSLSRSRRTLRAWSTTYVIVLASTFFYRTTSFSRIFLVLSAIALLPLAALAQLAADLAMEGERLRGRSRIRLLIVGADEFAVRTARSLEGGQEMPCTIAGFVRLPGQEPQTGDAILFELDELGTRLPASEVDDIILAIPPSRFAEIGHITARLAPFSIPVRAVLDFGQAVVVREQIFEFGELLMLDLGATSTESMMYLIGKRAFDIGFSVLVIALTAPLMALIALAVRLTSPGPVFFRQQRVGLNGQTFSMLKFRTMNVAKVEESDRRWTAPNDPRRTALGSLLRRTNLDELPQFFNVLIGQMSVVGPRPERPFFVRQFVSRMGQYNRRHYLKVGITGWAQVNGWRGDTSISSRLEHDLYYLQHWSLALDLRIIALTVMRMFSGGNAY